MVKKPEFLDLVWPLTPEHQELRDIQKKLLWMRRKHPRDPLALERHIERMEKLMEREEELQEQLLFDHD